MFNRNIMAVRRGINSGGAKAAVIPYMVDFSTLANGLLPSQFIGQTWSIASGKAVNVIPQGTNLLPDPDLEGTYTGGLNTALSKNQTPTVAQSADANAGSKAQAFTATAGNDNVSWHTSIPAGIAGQWTRFSEYAKNTSNLGINTRMGIYAAGGLPAATVAIEIISPTYAKLTVDQIQTATGTPFCYGATQSGATNTDAVIFDTGFFEVLPFANIPALMDTKKTDVIVKILPDTLIDACHLGLVIRADSQTSPTNAVFVMISMRAGTPTLGSVYAIKKLGSIYSLIQSELGVTLNAYSYLEARMVGTTFSIWYGGVKISTDITVSDAALQTGTFAGMFSIGDNKIKQLSVTANPNPALTQLMPIQMVGKPGLVMTFDDGLSALYTQAYAYMVAHRARATGYLITTLVGSASHITVLQAQEMYAAGWDMANHTFDHQVLTTLTEAQQETEFTHGASDLNGWGFTRSSPHVAYPGGANNADTLTAMAATGMLTGRTVNTNGATIYPMSTPYLLNEGKNFGNTLTLAAAKTWVAGLCPNTTNICVFHDLQATAVDNNTWAIADFQAFIDYCVTSTEVVFLTISEAYALNTAAVTVPTTI